MDHALPDYAIARATMVDCQLRPNKVIDPRILAAMRRLPRERFLPPALAARAYVDEDVPLGRGRALIEPMVLARLVQAATIRAGDRALVVGAATGYGAAVLAECGAEVTALEDDAELLAFARDALRAVGAAVDLASGPLAEGWAAAAPYDVILVEGAAEQVPPAFIRQLREAETTTSGRLMMVRRQAEVCQAVRGDRVGDGLTWQVLFDCATPLLPALRRDRGFVF